MTRRSDVPQGQVDVTVDRAIARRIRGMAGGQVRPAELGRLDAAVWGKRRMVR